MKKFISLLLAVMLVASISIIGFSAATTGTPLNTNQKVSFDLICGKRGYEFSVYKVGDLVTTSASPYTAKYNSLVPEISSSVLAGNSSSILTALDGIETLSIEPIGTYKVLDDGYSKEFTNMAQGIYYVRATNYPAGVKSVTNSVFALPYYDATAGWKYSLDGSVNLAAKVEEDTPTIVKKITNSTKNNDNFTDVSLGDTVDFSITTSTVGATNATSIKDFKLNSYVITDKMSKGLTLDQNSFAVKLTDASGTVLSTLAKSNYDVDVTAAEGQDTDFTVSLKKAYLQTENFYSAKYVLTTYSATLNKYAVTTTAGNPNEAVRLSYSNKNDITATVDGNTVYVYTYGVQVNKYDDSGAKLSGADFSLYRTEANATADENAIATGTSDANGKVTFKTGGNEIKLQSGTYYIRETKAPTGYNRYTDIIPITIAVEYNTTISNGTYVKSAPDSGVASVDVKNSKTILPQTGGEGYATLYIIVTLILFAAVSLILTRRKRKGHQSC